MSATAPELLRVAREAIASESRAIADLDARLGSDFLNAVEKIASCSGTLVATGMGKTAFLARRLAANFSSVGLASFFLHPADALHGDLGTLRRGDLLVALSHSGATDEILRLLPALAELQIPVIALTATRDSPLGRAADCVLETGTLRDGLLPTASSAALHALSDALVAAVCRARNVNADEVARWHPGGARGRVALPVYKLMRTGNANPLVAFDAPISQAVAVMTQTPGRPGCAIAIDGDGQLAGIFTDGDLRRLIEKNALDLKTPLRNAMTANPLTTGPNQKVFEAVRLLRERNVDQLIVVDEARRPLGLLDVQDLLAAGFLSPE